MLKYKEKRKEKQEDLKEEQKATRKAVEEIRGRTKNDLPLLADELYRILEKKGALGFSSSAERLTHEAHQLNNQIQTKTEYYNRRIR